MPNAIQSLWARAWACLTVSIVTFTAGGVLLYGAVEELYGEDGDSCRAAAATCQDPRGWVVLALTAPASGSSRSARRPGARLFLVDRLRRRRAAV